MIRFLRGALVVALLASCTSTPGTVDDVHTGMKGKHSAFYSVHTGLLDNLNAAAIIGTQKGVTKYGIAVRYTSTGVGWASFHEAWSFGEKLPYAVVREQLAGCGGGNCSIMEEGSIELTKDQFEQAAKAGFEFKLVGKNRSFVAKMPASVFQEALAQ